MRVSLINLNLVGADAIGQSILHQARYFLRRGDEVEVYVEHPPRDVPEEIVAHTHVVTLDDLNARRVDHFSRSDLYVYHYPGLYSLIDSLKRLDRGAVIFYYHNVTPPALWGSAFLSDHLQRSLDSVGALLPYSDLAVTDSPFNASDLVRDHGADPDRVRALPLAVPLDRFAPGPKDPALVRRYQLEGKRVIVFVGRMAGNKRPDILVAALSIVRQQIPTAVLVLAGDDRGNPAIQETVDKAKGLAAKLGLAEAVLFTGPVDDQCPYYHLADVYASASLHEGFGVPLIEAMACGVPVVSSNAASQPWVVGEAGLLAEAGDAADLARQLLRVLKDDELHGELVRKGLARAKEFSLEQYEAGWAKAVAEATTWLPQHSYPRLSAPVVKPEAPQPAIPPAQLKKRTAPTQLEDELRQLAAQADVMTRGYQVRSKAPLLGPLIAWVRRNLTSHLREPYLDPMFERQVAFNRGVAQALLNLADEVAALTAVDAAAEQTPLDQAAAASADAPQAG